MMWPLLILLVHGGLNYIHATDILYNDFKPCDDTNNITARIYLYQNRKQKNHFDLLIPIPAEAGNLILKFESPVKIKLIKPGRKILVTKFPFTDHIFSISFLREPSDTILNCTVFGDRLETTPYVQSILLNNHELCKKPKTDYYYNIPEKINAADIIGLIVTNKPSHYFTEPNKTEEKIDAPNKALFTMPNTPTPNPPFLSSPSNVPQTEELRPSQEQTCGRPRVLQTALIVHGQPTKSGLWPWHVAIFRIEKSSLRYICGGTLLSKTLVLTAAHCASIRGSAVVPEALRVDLGKRNLFGGNVGTQERDIFQVIIHPRYDGLTQDNDIALLKLKSEAVFTDYVRPACLWYEQANMKLPNQSIFGTVVGWGFDHQDSLSSTLQQVTIPILSELTCLKSNPTFFHQKLNNNKFCAGFANGSSPCNGDSGGGLMVFVTDTPGGTASGAWYIRGIVSIAPSRPGLLICDPYEYTIFTDVEKYRDWVLGYLNINNLIK